MELHLFPPPKKKRGKPRSSGQARHPGVHASQRDAKPSRAQGRLSILVAVQIARVERARLRVDSKPPCHDLPSPGLACSHVLENAQKESHSSMLIVMAVPGPVESLSSTSTSPRARLAAATQAKASLRGQVSKETSKLEHLICTKIVGSLATAHSWPLAHLESWLSRSN